MSELIATPLSSLTSCGHQPAKWENEQYSHKEFERVVPFSDVVGQPPPPAIGQDYLTSDLAAAFTTNIDNPVFKLPTRQDERDGAISAAFAMYAPYYIGTGLTPEQIANDVAGQAALYLKRLDAEHGYDGYASRVLSVLRRGRIAHRGLQGIEDLNILFDVHDFMAIITNRLHHVSPLVWVGGKPYSAAQVYRADTHNKVDPFLRTVVYQIGPGGYNKRFELPEFIRSDPSQLVELGWDFFDTKTLRRGAEFAALAAEKVGEPLVRGVLSEHYMPAHARRRQYTLAAC